MIHYDLICDQGHAFDGWFRDSAAYDAQAASGLVSCSVCGSAKVEKQLMAPGIPAKSNRKSDAPARMIAGPVDPRLAQLMQMVREMPTTLALMHNFYPWICLLLILIKMALSLVSIKVYRVSLNLETSLILKVTDV